MSIIKNIFPDYKLWKHVSFKILNCSSLSTYHHTPWKSKTGSASLYKSTPWCFTRGKFSNKLLLLEVIAFYSPICIKISIPAIVIQTIYSLCNVIISSSNESFQIWLIDINVTSLACPHAVLIQSKGSQSYPKNRALGCWSMSLLFFFPSNL